MNELEKRIQKKRKSGKKRRSCSFHYLRKKKCSEDCKGREDLPSSLSLKFIHSLESIEGWKGASETAKIEMIIKKKNEEQLLDETDFL